MIETTDTRWDYDGDGVNDEFDYDNRIDDESWLKVYVDCVLLVLNTDYTVSGVGEDEGGAVTINTPPPVGVGNVVILRATPQTQKVSFPFEGPFPSSVVERNVADKLEMQIQDIHEILGRCLKFAECSTFRDIEVPDPEANKILQWNPAADGLQNALAGDLGVTHTIVGPQSISAGATNAVITHNLGSASARVIGFSSSWFTGFSVGVQDADTITLEFDTECPPGGGTITTEVAL